MFAAEVDNQTALMEMGTPSIAAVYTVMAEWIECLKLASKSICEYRRYLTKDLIARARENEWTVCTPQEPELRNSIVGLEFDQPEEIMKRLCSR